MITTSSRETANESNSSASDVSVSVRGVSKIYRIWENPVALVTGPLLQIGKRLINSLGKRATDSDNSSPSRAYRHFHALREISFDLRPGESLGIIGLNGSGKSTLLQIIAGILQPTEGEVRVKGKIAALLELGSGFSPEFTGRENVYLNASLHGLSKREIDEKYEDIVTFADIGDFIDQPVKTYSSGMGLRLAFAVIAHVDADVLLIDEALAVGDGRFMQKCMRFLQKFRQEHAILFVTHDLAAMQGLCDRCLCLSKGKAKGIGTPKEITELYWKTLYEDDPDASASSKTEAQGKNQSGGRFTFNSNADSFGKGKAKITNLKLLNLDTQEPLRKISGGENVSLQVSAKIIESFNDPIIGFMLRNRRGQELFSENTYHWYKNKAPEAIEGKELLAEFRFRMPMLPKGEFSIAVAVSEGTQACHQQHHWIHDAMLIESYNSIHFGLMGLPMEAVTLRIV